MEDIVTIIVEFPDPIISTVIVEPESIIAAIEIANAVGPAGPPGGINFLAVPQTATSAGAPGDVAYDANFLYTCIAPNNWRRSPQSIW